MNNIIWVEAYEVNYSDEIELALIRHDKIHSFHVEMVDANDYRVVAVTEHQDDYYVSEKFNTREEATHEMLQFPSKMAEQIDLDQASND